MLGAGIFYVCGDGVGIVLGGCFERTIVVVGRVCFPAEGQVEVGDEQPLYSFRNNAIVFDFVVQSIEADDCA
jgi:hypothetical protein